MKEPTHKTLHSAGADLESNETVTIEPNQIRLVGTGFSLTYAQRHYMGGMVFILAIRSSIALKRGLMLHNSIGVIDSDFEDEIKAMFYNPTNEPVTIKKGERIAQLIPMQYVVGCFPCSEDARNGGFGSTNA